MKRPKYIILRLLLAVIPLLAAMAPAMAQNTVFAGQASDLGVEEIIGDTYVWELYNNNTSINFATVPGNCPPGDAYFTGSSNIPTVNVMWVTPGIYYFKVTAYRDGCTMNLKIGEMIVLNPLPTAIIDQPPPICAGDSVHLTVNLTGTAPWSFILTDGTNEWPFGPVNSSPYTLTVPVIPPVGTINYWIKEVTDAHGTNTTPSPPVVQVVNPKPTTGIIYHN